MNPAILTNRGHLTLIVSNTTRTRSESMSEPISPTGAPYGAWARIAHRADARFGRASWLVLHGDVTDDAGRSKKAYGWRAKPLRPMSRLEAWCRSVSELVRPVQSSRGDRW